MDKVIERESVGADEDLRDERFGWVWMAHSGYICSVCREKQPQSREACIEGHTLGDTHRRAQGIPVPWTLA